MIENPSMFTQAFQDQFNDNEFYATPRKTKLHLIIDGIEHIIGNSIVFNTETSNEQIPVYAYNNSLYAKYLNGKTVITGMIALRKTTVDRILSMVEDNSRVVEAEKEIKALEESMSNLESLSKEANDDAENVKISLMYAKKRELRDQIVKNKDSWYAKDAGFELSESIKDLIYLRRRFASKEISFKISFESDLTIVEDQIKDILFVKKSQDISIDKSDIIEIYQ
ncbi:MAG: hypothetical protein ACRC0G_10920, partial [Fusobacteriaceae bacterium]